MSRSASTPVTVDVSQIIDDASIESFHVGLFTLCALCMVMDGVDVYALGYVAPTIIQEWKISPALLGPVFGAVNVGVLAGQLSFTMLAGVLFFGVVTFVTARVTTISELLILGFIAGLGWARSSQTRPRSLASSAHASTASRSPPGSASASHSAAPSAAWSLPG
jgi:MFS family permease